MEFVHVLGIATVLISGVFLLVRAVYVFKYDQKADKGYQITNKKTGRQTTISANPNKADVKRFLELVDH